MTDASLGPLSPHLAGDGEQPGVREGEAAAHDDVHARTHRRALLAGRLRLLLPPLRHVRAHLPRVRSSIRYVQ